MAPSPAVRLRIINSLGEEVRRVTLGDPLYMRLEMLKSGMYLTASTADDNDDDGDDGDRRATATCMGVN